MLSLGDIVDIHPPISYACLAKPQSGRAISLFSKYLMSTLFSTASNNFYLKPSPNMNPKFVGQANHHQYFAQLLPQKAEALMYNQSMASTGQLSTALLTANVLPLVPILPSRWVTKRAQDSHLKIIKTPQEANPLLIQQRLLWPCPSHHNFAIPHVMANSPRSSAPLQFASPLPKLHNIPRSFTYTFCKVVTD